MKNPHTRWPLEQWVGAALAALSACSGRQDIAAEPRPQPAQSATVDIIPGRAPTRQMAEPPKMSAGDDEPPADGAPGMAGVPQTAQPTPTADDRVVTYHRDIRPLLERSCVACHGSDAATRMTPLGLSSWAEVEAVAERVATAVTRNEMPPFRRHPSCHRVSGERWLTLVERALFAAWLEDGLQQGDAQDFVPTPRGSQAPDQVLQTTMHVDDRDGLTRCYRLGPRFERDTFVTGFDLSPNVPAWHFELVAIRPDDDTMECFRDSRVLLRRSAGGRPVHYPAGSATRIVAGERLEVRTKVPPGGLDRLDATDAAPELGLWMLPEGELPSQLVVHDRIVPDQQVNQDLGDVIAMDPRASMYGSWMNVFVAHNGGQQCALDVTPWQFNFQEEYRFATPIPIPTGIGGVQFNCTYADQPPPEFQGQDTNWYDGDCVLDLWRLQAYP